jgi:hypothetical protein
MPPPPQGPSSFHNQLAFEHVHPAGEDELALARRELDRHGFVERKLAVDVVLFDYDLFSASLIGLSHEGHFGRHARLESEAGRLEAFAVDLDGRGLRAVLQRRLGGGRLSLRRAASLWWIAASLRGLAAVLRGFAAVLRGFAAVLRALAAILCGITAFSCGLAAILRALATILRGAKRKRGQGDCRDEQRDGCNNRFPIQNISPYRS